MNSHFLSLYRDYSNSLTLLNKSELFWSWISKEKENRWFSRYVVAAMLVDGKQKIAHKLALIVHQRLFISPLLFVSPEIAWKPPILSLIACLRPSQNVKLGIFTW